MAEELDKEQPVLEVMLAGKVTGGCCGDEVTDFGIDVPLTVRVGDEVFDHLIIPGYGDGDAEVTDFYAADGWEGGTSYEVTLDSDYNDWELEPYDFSFDIADKELKAKTEAHFKELMEEYDLWDDLNDKVVDLVSFRLTDTCEGLYSDEDVSNWLEGKAERDYSGDY